MASLTLKPRSPQTGGGTRGPVDHHEYGGGGGGRGDDPPNYGERLRRCRLGLALALVAITLLFVTFGAAFIARQGASTWDAASGSYVRDWKPVKLPMALMALNTLMLLASSLTVELARRQAAEQAVLAPIAGIPGIALGPKRPIPWLAISGLLGAGFLLGQGVAWQALVQQGLVSDTARGSSSFFVLTGAHAVHLLCGLLALLYALAARPLFSKTIEARRIIVDITAWYWHAMAVLWLYILAVLTVGSHAASGPS